MAVIAGLLVVVVAAGVIYQSIGLMRGARVWPPPGTMINTDNGQHLHVVCAGVGHPTVVFESGIAASSLSWTRVLPDVAAFTHSCAYDRAGLGWSEPTRGAPSLVRIIQELRAVLIKAGAGH